MLTTLSILSLDQGKIRGNPGLPDDGHVDAARVKRAWMPLPRLHALMHPFRSLAQTHMIRAIVRSPGAGKFQGRSGQAATRRPST